ncbi:hypothetical protein PG984_010277 [Apiospora sp. TS-2023a]
MPIELSVPNRLTLGSRASDNITEKTSQVNVSVEPSTEEHHVDIIDIRDSQQPLDLASDIRSGLQTQDEHGHRSLPSLLLWNERGLKLFEEVTYVPEYYLTNTEIELLKAHSLELADQIEPGTILLELGSGNLRKIRILLEALETLGKEVDYYALDLDRTELERTLGQLVDAGRFEHVRCHGLHGTYDDGQAWIARPENAGKPRCVLSLGSTLGSYSPPEAAAFLKKWADTLRAGDDNNSNATGCPSRIILGLDGCQDPDRVFAAYNDPGGVNKRFILNALDSANTHLLGLGSGYQEFDARDWTVRGEWDARGKRHVQYLVPLVNADVIFPPYHETDPPVAIAIKANERVQVGSSYKFDGDDKARMWRESWLGVVSIYLLHARVNSWGKGLDREMASSVSSTCDTMFFCWTALCSKKRHPANENAAIDFTNREDPGEYGSCGEVPRKRFDM